ncbi:hypothetical protein BJY04DRAFT_220165 [Aspergillus karnatakaensis]|uniref:putative integral membrane protein (Pth11) n=1 Tax=Aspergillus karnatakaensis TaxID=1810916 RepID=UPI003CCDAF0D
MEVGWVYNLDTPDPNNHIARVISVCVVFATAACAAVGLRFYVRIWAKKSVGLDDYAALSSALLGVAYAGLAVAQTRWGLGLEAEFFPVANEIQFSKMQYAGGPIYTLALLGFKIALLASYLRIGGFVRAYRMVIMGAIVACVFNQIVFTFVLSFGCKPVAKQWDPSIPGTCINTVASYYALAGTSLAFDVIIIALPLPILAKLQLKLRQKILLGLLFGLGFFVTIIQIIRVFTVKNLETYTDSQPIIIWSIVEISLGVIISCIPTYGPLFRALAIKFPSYRRRATQGYYGQTISYERSHGQSYPLSPTTIKHNSHIFEGSVPSTNIVGARNKWGDNGSEESILAEGRLDSGYGVEEGPKKFGESRTGNKNGRGRGHAKEMSIHIATEVRVERGPREGEKERDREKERGRGEEGGQ